jgi:peptidyl-tRNA hydrolase
MLDASCVIYGDLDLPVLPQLRLHRNHAAHGRNGLNAIQHQVHECLVVETAADPRDNSFT